MAPFSNVRNILFDLDGTLVDSKPGILAGLRRTLLQLGYELPATASLDWAIGPPLREVMVQLLAPFADTRADLAVTLYREWYGNVGLFDAVPYPGVAEVLDRLRTAGMRLFVTTSKRTPFAVRVLEHFGLAGQFEAIRGAEPHGRFDDKVHLVGDLLATAKLLPEETVLVGDREHDLLAARANGLTIVAAAYGYGMRTELAGADGFCEQPSDLAALLGAAPL